MFITGLGTATPAFEYSQEDCYHALLNSPQSQSLLPRSKYILRKVLLGDSGIDTRKLAFSNLSEAFQLTPDALHARFAQTAPTLAEAAARTALQQASLLPGEIDALIISTCTGYLCPGLTSYVSERLGCRSNTINLDLVGQGCGAALPNLATSHGLIKAGQATNVLSICVEVCSAALYLDDDPGVLISACLFGDGAAAAICSSSSKPGARSVQFSNYFCSLSPEKRDCLRFEQKQGMLRNVLDKQVPEIVGAKLKALFELACATSGMDRSQITAWILHTGGRDVLQAIAQKLQLTDDEMTWSRATLRQYGNMSSPSVLFTLLSALRQNAPGGIWWLASYGAGISCHGSLISVD